MKKLLEKKSLNFIINAINMEIAGTEDPSKLEISCESKPELFIRYVELDTSHDTMAIIQQKKLDIIKLEPTTDILILYKIVEDADKEKSLVNIPLYELKFMEDIFGLSIGFDEEIWDLLYE